MVDGLGSLEGTSLNEVASHVEEFPLHVFAGPGCARQLIHQRRSRDAQGRCRRGYRHGRAARGKHSLSTRPQVALRNWSNSLATEEDLGATLSEQDAEVHTERLGVSELTRPLTRRPLEAHLFTASKRVIWAKNLALLVCRRRTSSLPYPAGLPTGNRIDGEGRGPTESRSFLFPMHRS
jgi:hypothetical protein